MTIDKIFDVFTQSDWWEDAADKFLEVLNLSDKRFLLLYHADADGFCAGYFINRVLRRRDLQDSTFIITRAVRNHEFDFAWLPEYCRQNNPPVVICVDIPIIEAVHILKEISDNRKMAIYDHHVVSELPDISENILYINSRLLDSNQADHPASYFAASLAFKCGILRKEDIGLLASGLHCDRSFTNNESVQSFLGQEFPLLPVGSVSVNSVIKQFTSQINIYFKANLSVTPEKAQEELAGFLDNHSLAEARAWFSEKYNINEADRHVSKEVGFFLGLLRNAGVSNESLLCEVLACETFCVGIIASILVAEKRAAVVAIGYHGGDKIAFEIRTREDNNIDLASLLRIQRVHFIPLASGGHPKAAGALIKSIDIGKFKSSLRKALAEVTRNAP